MPTPTELAWAAGLFDGEGYIGYLHKASVQLALGMVDHACVRAFAHVVGVRYTGSWLKHSERNPNWNDAYYWRISRSSDVRLVLELLLPYLVAKRKRAVAALKRLT